MRVMEVPISKATRVPDVNEVIDHTLRKAELTFGRMFFMKLRIHQSAMLIYALLFALPPLYMSSRTSELFEFNKLMIIYVLAGCATFLWLLVKISSDVSLPKQRAIVVPMLIFVVSQIVSTWFSIDRHTSLYGYYGRFNGGLLSTLAYVLLACVCMTFLTSDSAQKARLIVHRLLYISLISASVVMLWGLPSKFGYDLSCLLFSGSFDVSCWTDQFKPTIRVFSTLGQPNWLGAYLVVHAILGLYFMISTSRLARRVMFGSFTTFAFIMILWTRSRSAYLGLAVGVLVLLGYVGIASKNYFRQSSIALTILAVIGAGSLVAIGTGIPRIDGLWRTDSPSKVEVQAKTKTPQITSSEDIRKIVWQGGLGLGYEYPWVGTGVETFGYSYPFVRPIEHNLTSEWDFVYNKAHNEYINMVATTGFLGLLAYIIMQGSVLIHARFARPAFRESEEHAFLIMALIASYVSIMVTNFFGFTTTTISIFTYMIPAFIGILVYRGKQSTERIEIREQDPVKLLVPVFVLLSVVWFVMGYVRADRAYARSEALSQSGDVQGAMTELYDAYSLRKEHVYADKLSQALAQMSVQEAQATGGIACVDAQGSADDCIRLSRFYAQKSVEGSPYNSAYYRSQARNSFLFYQATNDKKYFDEALRLIDRARMFAPSDPKLLYYKALFALGYIELSKKPGSADFKQLERIGLPAIEFALDLKPNYADAYYIKGLIHVQLKDTASAKKAFTYILENIDATYDPAIQELKQL